MALPEFKENGSLPEGEWDAGWEEIEQRFGGNFRRREIIAGLKHVVEQLRRHGVTHIWIDGSFATDKQRPNDADVVYAVPPGGDDEDWADVGPSRRRHLKRFHRVDLWRYPSWRPAKSGAGVHNPAGGRITIKEFFESDADGVPRGLIRLEVEGGNDDQE
jgi:hypothetical protein